MTVGQTVRHLLREATDYWKTIRHLTDLSQETGVTTTKNTLQYTPARPSQAVEGPFDTVDSAIGDTRYSARLEPITKVPGKRINNATDGIAETTGKRSADTVHQPANSVDHPTQEVADGLEKTAAGTAEKTVKETVRIDCTVTLGHRGRAIVPLLLVTCPLAQIDQTKFGISRKQDLPIDTTRLTFLPCLAFRPIITLFGPSSR